YAHQCGISRALPNGGNIHVHPEIPFITARPKSRMRKLERLNLFPILNEKAVTVVYVLGGNVVLVTKGMYTPAGLEPTLMFPGYHGGGNWSSASFVPTSGYLFVNMNEDGAIGQMNP